MVVALMAALKAEAEFEATFTKDNVKGDVDRSVEAV